MWLSPSIGKTAWNMAIIPDYPHLPLSCWWLSGSTTLCSIPRIDSSAVSGATRPPALPMSDHVGKS
jgi:hypothetical protein